MSAVLRRKRNTRGKQYNRHDKQWAMHTEYYMPNWAGKSGIYTAVSVRPWAFGHVKNQGRASSKRGFGNLSRLGQGRIAESVFENFGGFGIAGVFFLSSTGQVA
jgi:hypothetical protein